MSPPLPGRTGPLSLVDESRPHPRPLYRPRLAPPLRRSFLLRLGEAWPSLSPLPGGPLPLRPGPMAYQHWRLAEREQAALTFSAVSAAAFSVFAAEGGLTDAFSDRIELWYTRRLAVEAIDNTEDR